MSEEEVLLFYEVGCWLASSVTAQSERCQGTTYLLHSCEPTSQANRYIRQGGLNVGFTHRRCASYEQDVLTRDRNNHQPQYLQTFSE
jgi:hypothetical protein